MCTLRNTWWFHLHLGFEQIWDPVTGGAEAPFYGARGMPGVPAAISYHLPFHTKRRHIYSRHEDKSKSKTNGAQEEEHAAYSAADPLLPQRRQGWAVISETFTSRKDTSHLASFPNPLSMKWLSSQLENLTMSDLLRQFYSHHVRYSKWGKYKGDQQMWKTFHLTVYCSGSACNQLICLLTSWISQHSKHISKGLSILLSCSGSALNQLICRPHCLLQLLS